MIPAPTISDVLKMFGEETNPIPREKIVANYGDPSLVNAFYQY